MNNFQPSTSFVEIISNVVGTPFHILPHSMKRLETLAEYVRRVMIENDNMSASKVEARAKAEARARGLEDTHKCSDSTVGNILTDQAGNIGIYTLTALAWGIDRPVAEVVGVALGLGAPTYDRAFNESELYRLFEIYRELPADDKKFYNRQIESIGRDMLIAKRAKQKSG